MRIYLDNCTFNRPFDDQRPVRIRLESEAKLHIQEKIRNGSLNLVWSYILSFENKQNPFDERRNAIQKWKSFAELDIVEDQEVISKAENLTDIGLKTKDALHIACAIEGKAEYFLTTDDRILEKLSEFKDDPDACIHIKAMNPLDFIKILEET